MVSNTHEDRSSLPLVHVVIVHLHGLEMLSDCLSSLMASSGVHLEIVLVLNDCREDLPTIAHSHPGIHLVRTPAAMGFSAANNFGVAWAREHIGAPHFYYFLNNDTVSTPDALALQITALKEENASVVGPLLVIQGAERHLNSLGLNVTEDAWGWDEGIGLSFEEYGQLPQRREVIAVTGSAFLTTASAHEAVGGWTELYGYYFEDIDYCLKVRRKGWKVLHEPSARVLHRISATMSIGSQTKFFLFRRNRLLLAMVHWPVGLLLRLLKRSLLEEILGRPREQTELERRGFLSAVSKLPKALIQRFRNGRQLGWVHFLHPPGSVPTITLPQPYPAAESESSAHARVEVEVSQKAEPIEAAFDPLPLLSWLDGDTTARRVLVLGWSPLPFENTLMNFAPGVRSWQFAQPLANDGNLVCLVCARIPGTYQADVAPLEVSYRDNVLVYTVEREDFASGSFVPDVLALFRPDCVVGAAPVPSQRAVELADDLPLWIDTFGDPMAEAQAKAQSQGDEGNHPLAYARLLSRLLERGDRFSAVSERQRLALVGQLGLVGRLTAEMVGYDIVTNIPCCGTYNRVTDAAAPEESGVLFAPDDFVVFWSGGFNTWCDAETLVRGLEMAMQEDPKIHFLSTGGSIKGHDTRTYQTFKELVRSTRFPERFVLKGTLPKREADGWSVRADLGVVTEKRMLERELGSSGRVLNWLTQGLPVVCTNLSEIGEILEREGGAFTYRVGDAEHLAEKLLAASRDPHRLEQTGLRGKELAEQLWSAEVTTRPLQDWVRHASRAPDAQQENPVFDVDLLAANQELSTERDLVERAAAAAERLRAEVETRVGQLEGEKAHLESEKRYYQDAGEHWQRQLQAANKQLEDTREPTLVRFWRRMSRFLS